MLARPSLPQSNRTTRMIAIVGAAILVMVGLGFLAASFWDRGSTPPTNGQNAPKDKDGKQGGDSGK
jgi:hypothetical protein